MKNLEREYGIDAIRVFAMILVIIGHIIGRGGYWTLPCMKAHNIMQHCFSK